MTRDRIVLTLAALLTVGVFLVDVVVFPELPVPALPYAIPIVIAAWLLPAGMVAGVSMFTVALLIVSVVVVRHDVPIWVRSTDVGVLAIIGGLGTVVAARIRRETALAKERARMLERMEEMQHLIAHDLRQPLTTITGQSDWLGHLLRQKGEEREAKAAESILKGAKRMNVMIQDLVESARWEIGRVDLRLEPTDLVRLVYDASERVGGRSERMRIRVETAESILPGTVDAARIERVLTNLLTNALRYSAPDTPIVVRVERQGSEAITSVTDSGPGIPPDSLSRLFEKYYRAGAEAHPEGLGLGLYICRLIVQAHGGRIWANSTVGVGSTFSFTLPVKWTS